MTDLTLIGYSPSVYSRAVRMALRARSTPFEWVEVDPFDVEGKAKEYHPFGRVPVLLHGTLRVYETSAILIYLDAVFGAGPPTDPVAQARIAQVGAIVDNYGYWPLIRQVFVEGVLAHTEGRAPDRVALAEGMREAGRILDALNDIASEGRGLNAEAPGRADWHLAPMIDLFTRHAPAATALDARPALARWFATLQTSDVFVQTAPESSPA